MKEKILSQDEISALLDAIGSEKPAAPKAAEEKSAGGRWRTQKERKEEHSFHLGRNIFPLIRTQTLTKDIQGALALVFDTFAHKGTSTLSTTFRTHVGFKLQGMDQVLYGDFVESLPEPSSMWYLQMSPYEAHLAVCLEPALVHAIIAVLMGGGNTAPPRSRRNVTELEQSVIESVITVFCREMKHAWNRIFEVNFSIDNRDTRPRLLQIYPSSEPMIVVSMSMKVGPTEADIYWGIPASILKVIQTHLNQQNQNESRQKVEQGIRRIKEIVEEVSTCLEAQVATTRIPIQDLLSLRVGDVLKLEHRTTDPLVIKVNGREKFLARVVLSNDRKAIQLI